MITKVTARRLLQEDGQLDFPVIQIEDGLIVSIEAGDESPAAPAINTLTAGFFDIHVHGAVSTDFMDAGRSEIDHAGRFLATRGVAHYLPTTVTGSIESTLRALDCLADAIERHNAGRIPTGVAAPVGIHLEGPFVSHIKRGVHPVANILEPSIGLFDRFQQAARGHICLMTMAPELPGALDLIAHATANGVRISMGHSNATAAEALAAVRGGAASGTHAFNAMRALDHREPGILGTLLDRDDLYAEAIADGIHVDPAIIRLWLKAKGPERGILVTDGISATGMPDGLYKLGDLPVEVKDGVCLSNGALAGSVLTMDQAVANLQSFTGSSLGTAVQLASRNPARMLGMSQLVAFAPGSPANFNLFDASGKLCGTILRGQRL